MKAKKDTRKKDNNNTFITMSTISDKLPTDQNYLSPPQPPEPTKICGLVTVHKVAIFGITFNAITLFTLYVYALIRLIQKTPTNYVEIIVISSILICILILFTLLFILAIFRTKPKLLLPYIIFSTVLFFAFAGAVIASVITVADEIRDEVNGEDRTYKIVDIILIRLAFIAFGLIQILFIYSYIRTFMDVRRLNFFNRR
ncbi:unnamed protein product [Caenorhabditis angaria]|uniref:Uncharacterized protein n=1 Tax=Caenorhabditis angaria TaxID=860376 RepID=A0A9P1IRD8_9PELO|nr:unnamed protein product [Caenorhabditis angaria]